MIKTLSHQWCAMPKKSLPSFLPAKRIIVHPNYERCDKLSADIALIQLERPLKLNDRVVKACMPQQGVYPRVGKNCYIAGKIILSRDASEKSEEKSEISTKFFLKYTSPFNLVIAFLFQSYFVSGNRVYFVSSWELQKIVFLFILMTLEFRL